MLYPDMSHFKNFVGFWEDSGSGATLFSTRHVNTLYILIIEILKVDWIKIREECFDIIVFSMINTNCKHGS